MKKLNILFASTLALCLSALSACGKPAASAGSAPEIQSGSGENTAEVESKDGAQSKPLSIVTTIFPEYDWVRTILGDEAKNTDLKLLLDQGVDLHSYQPTTEDVMSIANSDLFIYVGGESDGWVQDALKNPKNPNRQVINLMDTLGDTVREEETVEGMQEEHEDEEHGDKDGQENISETTAGSQSETSLSSQSDTTHSTGPDSHDAAKEEPEYDEHVWLSLRNAKTLCSAIETALEKLDPQHASDYQANLSDYTDALTELDGQYQTAVQQGSRDTILFGDRFPFRYLVDDYGIHYYAAFSGCSADADASFETVVFLAGKVDELELPCVLTIEQSDQRIAKSIIENTKTKDQEILVMDSLQSTTLKDIEDGKTYISAMKANLDVLSKALL